LAARAIGKSSCFSYIIIKEAIMFVLRSNCVTHDRGAIPLSMELILKNLREQIRYPGLAHKIDL
jgi:hypothetical protein